MSRKIDADRLIEAFKDYPFGDSITLAGVIEVIEGFTEASATNENTVDVVPVVRCNKCKKWDKNGICEELTSKKMPTGGRFAFKTNGNDYCSYGMRKDGEQK